MVTSPYSTAGQTARVEQATPALQKQANQPKQANATPVPLSVSRRLGLLQFHLSGKFRVLHVADLQEGPTVSADTIRILAAACDQARPDIVIFTGNQIKGYDKAFSATFRPRRWRVKTDALLMRNHADRGPIEQTRALVRHQAAQFLAPLIERGIPFAITYGNHDFQCGLTASELDEIYREFPGCLNPAPGSSDTPDGSAGSALSDSPDGSDDLDGFASEKVSDPAMPRQRVYPCESGTFALPVWDVPDDEPVQHGIRVTRGVYEEQRARLDGTHLGEDAVIRASRQDRPVFALVCLFSGDYARSGGYGAPSRRALSWLSRVPRTLGVKSLIFQHFALPQTYQLLTPVPATAAGAIQGYGNQSAQTFRLDDSKILPGSVLAEGISTPAHDAGEWQVITEPVSTVTTHAGQETNGFIGVVSGHDHRNAFAGMVEGILLAATPTSGFGSYGPPASRRAVRLIEFDARHPWHPRTKLLTFGDLVGGRSSRAVYTFASSHVPVNVQQAQDAARRPRTLAALATAIALISGISAGLRRVFTHHRRKL